MRLEALWKVVMSGQAFAGRCVGKVLPVVSAVANLVGEDGDSYAAYSHEALCWMQVQHRWNCFFYLCISHFEIQGMALMTARCKCHVHYRPGLQMLSVWRTHTSILMGQSLSTQVYSQLVDSPLKYGI